MKRDSTFIDSIYEYKGQWDTPSKCGLKLIKKEELTIAIVSELYEENPGTSVTYWNYKIAELLCIEYNISPEKLLFIEHNPDMGSKLENYAETFDIVKFDITNDQFSNPSWERISREDVEKMIG